MGDHPGLKKKGRRGTLWPGGSKIPPFPPKADTGREKQGRAGVFWLTDESNPTPVGATRTQ